MTVHSLVSAARSRHGITVAGVGAVLGVAPRTVAAWVDADRLPPGPQGLAMRWLAGAIDDAEITAELAGILRDALAAHTDGRRGARRAPVGAPATRDGAT